MSSAACVIPTLRYRDARGAIAWLCAAFGFSEHLVVPGEGDLVVHAELKLGAGMIMLGSAQNETEFAAHVIVPADAQGKNTQTIYAVVPDPDAHHARAAAAGAEIVLPLKTQDYGGRDYTCRDPEGHIWTFGNYDPWRAT